MKFACDKTLLCEIINNVSLAVASKSTLISLEGILMRCRNNTLTLTGYNLELGMTKSLEVRSSEDGEIVLNASLLSNIVNRMPAGEILFASDNKLLTVIKCADAEFTILGLSTDDYPEIPSISKDQELELPLDSFRGMIAQTLFAVAQTEQTPVYTGTLFELESGVLAVVSVDGYRLAMKRETVGGSEDMKFVVPGKTLGEIQKLLAKFASSEEEDEKIALRVSNKHIIFEMRGYSIISRLLDGEFLDYKNAIPKGAKTTVTVSTRDFLGSINRASIIINDRAKSPIRCEFTGSVVKINCETTLGKVQDSFLAELDGEDVKIGFNNKYMSDALKASECDKVLLEMSGPLSPIKILPLEGEDFLFLVLPVRLKD